MASEHYFVNNNLTVTLECQRTGSTLDMSDYKTVEIQYKKPSGAIGAWTATLDGTHKMTYEATSTNGTFDINESGTWLLKAYIEFNSGAIYQGDVVELEIFKAWWLE